jgi:ribosome modulation factor
LVSIEFFLDQSVVRQYFDSKLIVKVRTKDNNIKERMTLMKKLKRDLHHRAYIRGYRAGMAGRSKGLSEGCSENARPDWLAGWREGREDKWNGLTSVEGTHKAFSISH